MSLRMDRTKRLHSELCKAIHDGDTRTVQFLLLHGAQADAVGSEGVAAIHLAVGKENEKNQRCLKFMLQKGVNPNIKSSDGLTPLHIAAVWGCFQNVKLLLTNGGNPNLTDNDGNTPLQLAKEQGNRKCAQILQGFQTDSAATEEEDVPRFHYSVYSDLTDTSSFPDSECSFSSSRISDFGDAPLSSTRRSSFFKTNEKPQRFSHVDDQKQYSQEWNSWTFEGPSLLSSTRVSSAGRLSSLPVLKEHDLWTNVGRKSETLPVLPIQRNGRKSVTFRNVDEFFPVFSPDSNRHSPPTEGTPHSLTFDPTEYSDFLDSERMATVCQTQGIDVTSPDHVYVFQRESSESTQEDLEKTVNAHFVLDESDGEEQLPENVKGFQTEKTGSGSSSSGGTTSSRYSSCDSDHYTSALENTENLRVPSAAGECKEEENDKGCIETHEIQEYPIASSQPSLKCNTVQYLSDSFNNLALSEANPCNDPDEVKPYTKNPDLWNQDLSFSPFVTDRTRARLSRCSLRTSRASESLLATSTLFEDTLPTPVRSLRATPQSRNSERNYNGRHTASPASYDPINDEVVSTLYQDTPRSQGDTISLSQTINDTCPFVETQGESFFLDKDAKILDAYERNFAEIVKAIQNKATDNFLTDDLTSTEDGKREVGKASRPSADEAWVTEDCDTQPESVSSSSSSSYFSPKRSREDSDPPCTPGTGCTPRYSVSRLSGCSRPRSYASISYTPGGRPQIDDVDEPVEYLYTDTEQGHTFIETHIPPTANTSLSSSSSSDETILYDWRSMHRDIIQTEKENQRPKPGLQRSSSDSDVEILPETRGLTDRELRMRLLDLGESPGPICSRTRPTYMRKLCRLLDESKKQPQNLQKPSDQTLSGQTLQKPSDRTLSGYSPELCRALRTFELPQCQEDEQALCRQFEQVDLNRKWREGVIKSSFNYLLLDPRVTNNLPFRSHTLSPRECFKTFVNAIFYVGKGKRSRPYSHLYEALDYFKGDKTSKKLCRKVDHILQVWNVGQGVISLHCFQNVIPVEAYTREACMVEAIGLKMLTNQKRGDYYGVVSNWQQRKKKELGVHLLYRAMQIFLAEGERQLRPADIRQ